MAATYRVILTPEERRRLDSLAKSSRTGLRTAMLARALLLCDESPEGPGWASRDVGRVLGIPVRTADGLKRRLVEDGMDRALGRAVPPDFGPRPPRPGGPSEALPLASSGPTQARARWTASLLGSNAVELSFADPCPPSPGPGVPASPGSGPPRRRYFRIPAQSDAAFVAHMEDLLGVYLLPRDPLFPVLCLDWSEKRLVAGAPGPGGGPITPGVEFSANGLGGILMAVEPLAGRRLASVSGGVTHADLAVFLRKILDEQYPEARKVALILDYRNTHALAALHETLPRPEASRLCGLLEIHRAPRLGSWLNMARIELGVLNGQRLEGRIGDLDELRHEVGAWQDDNPMAPIAWRLSFEDARKRLRHLYPIPSL